MKISEIITDKYKLRIPPTVYYDLLADVQEVEEEQEPRKGKWLAIRTKDGIHEMTCSCCGYVRVELINRSFTEETALEHLKDWIEENKFCPNCGADMREVEE